MVTSDDLWAIFCYMGIDSEVRMMLRIRRSCFNQMDGEQKTDAFREMPVWASCAACPGSGIPDFRGKNGLTTGRRAGLRDQSRGSDLQKQEKAYVDLAVKKDGDLVDEIRRDKDMTNAWMDIFKDEIEQRIEQRLAEKMMEITCQDVKEGWMSVENAARKFNMTVSDFEAEMNKRGYQIPDRQIAAV